MYKSLANERVAAYIRTDLMSLVNYETQALDLANFASRSLNSSRPIFIHDDQIDKLSAFDRLLKDIKHGLYSTLIVWRLDRLGPWSDDLESFVLLLKEFETHGVRFVSVKDSLDTSSSGGHSISQIVESVNRSRSNQRTERAKAGLHLARQSGTSIGRPQLQIDSQVAEMRRQGLSIRKIAEQIGISPTTVQEVVKRIAHKTKQDLSPE